MTFMSRVRQSAEPGSSESGATAGPAAASAAGQGDSVQLEGDSVQQRARILILEDQAFDAELAQRLLAHAGLQHTAVVVDTQLAFVEQLTVFRPDIILSDFHLPGFTGERALEIAQQQCPQLPFIFWSGVLGDEVAAGLIKKGATDYILKDRPARLPAAIRHALGEAEQRARLARLEGQLDEHLVRAQSLASRGQLAAAAQTMEVTRELLAAARQETAAPDLPV
jgi:CheY-like chemotaxis protein